MEDYEIHSYVVHFGGRKHFTTTMELFKLDIHECWVEISHVSNSNHHSFYVHLKVTLITSSGTATVRGQIRSIRRREVKQDAPPLEPLKIYG